jgi:hypothetical protein
VWLDEDQGYSQPLMSQSDLSQTCFRLSQLRQLTSVTLGSTRLPVGPHGGGCRSDTARQFGSG